MITLIRIKPLQQGFSLFMTLVTLVIITISGISMMRVMEAGVSSAGNIAFRQAAIRSADVAVEDARNWVSGAAALTDAVSSGVNFYCATLDTAAGCFGAAATFDPAAHDWANFSRALATNASVNKLSGYDVNYVIHRVAMHNGLCSTANTGCAYPSKASTSGICDGCSHAPISYQPPPTGAAGLVYYRVTVKVSGPRHNVTYVQTLMY